MEYGNDLRAIGRGALVGSVLGLLAVLATVVGVTVEGRWSVCHPGALLVLFLAPFLPVALVTIKNACVRVRVAGMRVQYGFLRKLVLQERPLAQFVRVELQPLHAPGPRVCFQGGGEWRRPRMHPAELARMERDLQAFPRAAQEAEACGSPFRPVTVEPGWLTWHGGAAVKLAQAIYEDRELPSGHLDAARLAVLADLLEEAGCSDPHLLGHLRSPGPHVRGCVAVDALLGRS